MPLVDWEPTYATWQDKPSRLTAIKALALNNLQAGVLAMRDAVNNLLQPKIDTTGASTGDVATLQSDGSFAAESAPGGSTSLDAGYLMTTGVNGDYAASQAAICTVTGAIDVRWFGSPLSITSSGSFRDIVSINGAFRLRQMSSNGKPQVWASHDNGSTSSTAGVGTATIPAAAAGWRATVDPASGQVKIFALDAAGSVTTADGKKWTQIGSTGTISISGSFTPGAKSVAVGAAASNGTEANALNTTAVQIFDGIDGTKVVDIDFTGRNQTDGTFADASGNVWQLFGKARLKPVSVSLTKGGVSTTLATTTDVSKVAGAWGSKRVNPLTGKFHPFNFGDVGVDPATWSTAQQADAIRAANEAARVASSLPNATGATLRFDRAYTINADTTLLDPLSRLPYCAMKYWDNVTYEGSGLGSVLTLDAQANVHMFGHPGRLQSDGSQDQIFNVSIRNLVIDGNLANQDGTHMHDGFHFTMCPGLTFVNSQGRNCDGNGYYSSAVGEFGAGAGTLTTAPMVWTTNTAPATITVTSTAPFPATGQLVVFDGTGNQRSVAYTGLTGTTFTGVTLLGGTAVAGTVPSASLVMVDPGAHIVMPMTLTSPRFTGNARWGMMCGATNRHVTYTDIHADGNGTLQALIAGRMPCQTIVANGHVDLVIDDGTSIAVNLLAGDTAATIATKITAGLASMQKAVGVTFSASADSVTFASPHKVGVGTPVVFSALAGGVTGITAGTTYYVHQVLSSTAVTLTLQAGGLGFGSTVDITHDGTGTGTYGAPIATLTASGILKIASGIWGGTSRVYLQTSSTTGILINLGLTISPILIAENSFRAGAQEYGGVRYDQSESVSSGTWTDSNVGDGVYIHNVNQRHDVGIHSTRNGGIGIYVDAWDHSTGVAWDASMNCTDFGYASYRVDGFGSANTAELYFDNGVEGYGLTHNSTLYGFVGPGDKSTIGGKPDNRCAAWAVFVADGHTFTVGSDRPNPASLHITKINPGDGGLTGVLRPPAGYVTSAPSPLIPTAKTANYTAVRGDLVLCDTSGGTFTVLIPAAAGANGTIGVKWVKGAVAPTIALSGTDHFNTSTGGTSTSPTLLNQGYLLASDATSVWVVAADDLPLSGLDARYAGLASPVFIGNPTAPTPASGDNTTSVATTAFVQSAVAGLLDFRGNFDASANIFPTTGGSGSAGAILKADFWVVSVAGTLGGTAVAPGDWLAAKVDTPGSTAGNWSIIEHDLGYTPAVATRQIATGTGLLGGGDLSADRTLTPDFGTGAGKVTQGNDPRLSDARTPNAHAASHTAGGSDQITVTEAQVTGLSADLAAKLAATTTLDAILNPTAARAMNAQKITGLANGTADTDAQAFGQRPFDAGKLSAAVTVSNVSGAQQLWAATTIPAAKLAVGSTFFYTVTGTLDNQATSGAFTFLTKVNGSAANSSAMPSQTGAASGVFWSLVVYVTVIATGVGGSINVTGFLTLPTAAAGTQGQKIIGNVQAVDLSAGLTIRADINMATASATNVVRAQAGCCAQSNMP